jgi:hypothetical protein
MWNRPTWHEYAEELDAVGRSFRRAYYRKRNKGLPRHPEDEHGMEETSKRGVQILRALALAVRSEQDFDLLPRNSNVVGVIKEENAVPSDATEVKQRGGYANMLEINGYHPLDLREALNKIAHADPQKADLYIGPMHRAHDLLLYGTMKGKNWFAVISVLEIVKTVRSLPDAYIVAA